MVLLQLGITYDEVVGTTSYFPQSNNSIKFGDSAVSLNFTQTPIRVLRNVNLPSGRYKCKIVGVEIASGYLASYAFVPQIIQLKSPQFLTQSGQDQGFLFANNNQYTIQDTGGDRTFYMQTTGNWIELNMSIYQYSNQDLETNIEWGVSGFAFFVMTLDVMLEDSKCLFGNAK